MTNRENQRRLDSLAMLYLTALEGGDFEAIDDLWNKAEGDPDLSEMLHGLNAEFAAQQDAHAEAAASEQIVGAIEKHMPSAEVIRPAAGPVTMAEVAEIIRK